VKIFLLSPTFHGYWCSYLRAFESLGHTVDALVYQRFTTVRARVRNKVVYEFPGRFGSDRGTAVFARDVTRAAVERLGSASPDKVLVIKGDVLEQAFWDAVDRRGLASVLYLYDDLTKLRHTEDTLRRPRHLATFSARDQRWLTGKGYPASYVPMAFDPNVRYSPRRQDAVVFVGSRYPDREAALAELHRRGVPVMAYGREWSRHPFDRLRSWQWHRPAVPARRDVTLSEALGITAGAGAAFNSHAGHEGFNPRTFETSGVGGLQLIDREDVAAFYEPGREVLVYRSHEELVELSARALRDRAWGRQIRTAARARTLAQHTYTDRARALSELW